MMILTKYRFNQTWCGLNYLKETQFIVWISDQNDISNYWLTIHSFFLSEFPVSQYMTNPY